MSQGPDQSEIKPRFNEEVNEFLSQQSCYAEAAIEVGCTYEGHLYMAELDRFEYQLRQYIAGTDCCLFQLLDTADNFILLNKPIAYELMRLSLGNVQRWILEHEYFELMSRYTTALNHLQREFKLYPEAPYKE